MTYRGLVRPVWLCALLLGVLLPEAAVTVRADAMTPAASSGCAAPADGWQIAGWSGTADDAGTAGTNTVTMPAGDKTVNITYAEGPAVSSSVLLLPSLRG